MKKVISFAPFVALLAFAPAACAQDSGTAQDAAGCKDSTVIGRVAGSHITSCDKKDHEQTPMPIGKDQSGGAVAKTVEGEYRYWVYGTRDLITQTGLVRAFEAALPKSGFHIEYEDKPQTITAHKGNTWILLNLGGPYYYQTIVTTKESQQNVDLDPDAISEALAQKGHIALYGVHFETNKATIRPDSEGALQQTLQFLIDNPSQKLKVVAYPDNTGSYDDDLKLTDARAQAIVAWLVAHGVEKNRLSVKSFGQADEASESIAASGNGRRVELVKP
jgi:OOP family OmpA-OmpF porin